MSLTLIYKDNNIPFLQTVRAHVKNRSTISQLLDIFPFALSLAN